MHFEKDWRALIGNACWSWILIWIPVAIEALKISRTSMRLDGGVLQYATGALSKRYTNIDLYRVRSVAATDSVFTGGKLIIQNSDGSQETLKYVRNAGELSGRFRTLIDAEREKHRIHTRENL